MNQFVTEIIKRKGAYLQTRNVWGPKPEPEWISSLKPELYKSPDAEPAQRLLARQERHKEELAHARQQSYMRKTTAMSPGRAKAVQSLKDKKQAQLVMPSGVYGNGYHHQLASML